MNVNAKNHQDSGAGSAGVLTEFAFSESKKAISVIQLDQPWFAAVDVCNILGLTNPADIVKKTLDEDEYLTYTVYRSGQLRELLFVNEPGLYALIFKSRKNEAKSFRRWVTHEILPQLRINGHYSIGKYKVLIPKNAEIFAGIKMIRINGEKFYRFRDVAKRLGWLDSTAHSLYIRGRKVEPECFVNIDGVSMVLEAWIERKLHDIVLRDRRLVAKKTQGGIA